MGNDADYALLYSTIPTLIELKRTQETATCTMTLSQLPVEAIGSSVSVTSSSPLHPTPPLPYLCPLLHHHILAGAFPRQPFPHPPPCLSPLSCPFCLVLSCRYGQSLTLPHCMSRYTPSSFRRKRRRMKGHEWHSEPFPHMHLPCPSTFSSTSIQLNSTPTL
jgi:hypothetical protein